MAYDGRALFRASCPDPSFRNPQGAIEDAKKACGITQWKEADPIDTLAIAYAAAGDFDSALRYEQQAMQAYDAGSMSKTLHEHLVVFKQHRPIRGN
jgi:tetratricopeptide (TPR) repeat protein